MATSGDIPRPPVGTSTWPLTPLLWRHRAIRKGTFVRDHALKATLGGAQTSPGVETWVGCYFAEVSTFATLGPCCVSRSVIIFFPSICQQYLVNTLKLFTTQVCLGESWPSVDKGVRNAAP